MPWGPVKYKMLSLDYQYWISYEIGYRRDYFGHMYFDKDMNNIAIVKFDKLQTEDGNFSWNSGDNYKLIVSKTNRIDAISLMNDFFDFKLEK